eukprot:TRINITY_DN6029_c1_g1_i1.p1 TRINITY_DN6029_c1_g1~~TRINITY_DN6029_c1_g1_i1.p1  ORF type:complete len:875 (-),score=152.30 TRINITY_DN6029_c1_g1_i1:69-2693(-)
MPDSKFYAHSKAVGRTLFKQHSRSRSVVVHFLRVLSPTSLLVLLWYNEPNIRSVIIDEITAEKEQKLKTEIAREINKQGYGDDETAVAESTPSFLSLARQLFSSPDPGFGGTIALSTAFGTTRQASPGEPRPARIPLPQVGLSQSNNTQNSTLKQRGKANDKRSYAFTASASLVKHDHPEQKPTVKSLSHTRTTGAGTSGKHAGRLDVLPMGQAFANTPNVMTSFSDVVEPGAKNLTADDITLTDEQLEMLRSNVSSVIEVYVVEALDIFYCELVLITVLMGMTFFVGKLAGERASGLRHLLHISGISRTSFWTMQGGLEGVALHVVEVVWITVLCAPLLRVRVVMHTSAFLLVFLLTLIAAATVTTGATIYVVSRSTLISNIASMSVAIALVFACPAYWGMQGSLAKSRLPWYVMSSPMLTSSSCLYRLVVGCAKNETGKHCLQVGDLFAHDWIMPWQILFGTNNWKDAHAAGQLVGLVMVAILQIVVLWVFIIVLDVFQFSPLLRNQADSKDLGSFALKAKSLEHDYVPFPVLSICGGRFRALNGVSLTISPGAMLGLLGPNGAGKTTTIRCITGEESPTGGEVLFRARSRAERAIGYTTPQTRSGNKAGSGDDSIEHPLGDISAVKVKDSDTYVGLCPQETALADDLTVFEHLVFFAEIREAAEPVKSANDFLQVVRLEAKRDEVPSCLSGGMRRRLAIGCSMVGDPDLALLDEPTTGLDPSSRRHIWEAIMDARNMGTACLLTTHLLEEAEYLSTNVIIMTQGKIAAEGTVQQLKDRYTGGYQLSVDAMVGEEGRVKEYVATLLPTENKDPVHESLHGNLVYNVSKDAKLVGGLFLELAASADANGVRSWGVSQGSLEDAYLRILESPPA